MEVLSQYEYREVTRDGEQIAGKQRWAHSSSSTWVGFEAQWTLLKIHAACEAPLAAEAIWANQDGYGAPGTTPAQGWDWSGIRDSSPEAIARMYDIATEFISDAELSEKLGLTA